MTRVERRLPAFVVLLVPLLLCSMCVEYCRCQGLSVIGPKFVQPSRPYTVVFTNSLTRNVRLEVTLQSHGDSDTTHQHRQNILVSRTTLRAVSFPVENLPEGAYSLSIRSLDANVSFDEEVELIYSNKSMSIFIQTDKPVYKPDDKLQFRVIILDSETRPVTNVKTVAVSLIDAEANSIRQWPFARLYNGVFESAVQLASSPVLGLWNLMVTPPGCTSEDCIVTKQILLEEYVLPTFYVKARASEILLITNKKVSILVESSYTFGGYVDGTVKVDLYLNEDGVKPDYFTKTHITGVTTVEFNLNEELDPDTSSTLDYRNVFVKVEVMETFTNRTLNITETIPVYNDPYKISVTKSSPRFWPGIPYLVILTIKDHRGVPVSSGEPIDIIIRYEGSDLDTEERVQKTIGQQGSFSLELEPPIAADTIELHAEFESVMYESVALITGAQSKSNQYIRILLNPKYRLRVGKDVQFDVTCTEMMKHFSYIVISRGSIVDSNYVKVANKKRYALKLKMTPRMAPQARIILFYSKDDFLVTDDLELNFELFTNDFKLSLDRDEYVPGQDIYVDIETAAGSYVALNAIDQSALLLGRDGHSFTKDDVLSDLALYGATDYNEFDPFNNMALFLRTTSTLDIPMARGQLSRFGLLDRHAKAVVDAIHIRTVFPETWLWTNFTMRRPVHQYVHTVPDTITSWYVTGFAIHPTLGLGIMKQPQSLVVKQPFYLIANLPYSIKRGETALVQVTIFNFLGNTVTTDVTLYNKNDEIEFIGQPTPDSSSFKKVVIAPNNSGKPVSFMIKAKKLGEIAIKIEAVNLLTSDAIEHMLRVTPESHLYEINTARFIELPKHGTQVFDIGLNIPRDVDEGSVKINFTLDANLLGTTIANLDSLVKVPTGCGEQNMLHFVPNIVILDYLNQTGTINPGMETKIKNHMESGYQNQLKYKRPDGAFSVWGPRDSTGSTFLTAFVAKSFKIADKYINVDKNIVSSAFDWLAKTQTSNGKFDEVGSVWHADMQGALRSSNFALTAYVTAAFLESKDEARKHRAVVEKATSYLVKNFANMDDPYDLALTTYALSLGEHSMRVAFLEKLLSAGSKTVPFWTRSSGSIEIAGYAVLSQVVQGTVMNASSTVQWLNTQRYATGSFGGTQDTFVGLKALAEYASRLSSHRNDFRVTIRHEPARVHVFHIDRHKSLQTQHREIPDRVRQLNIAVEGIGIGFFQVAAQYYRNIQIAKQSFALTVTLMDITTHFVQHLHICVAYEPKEAYQRTNMAIVEVFFPSGVIAERDAVTDLSSTGEIRHTELRFGGSSIAVYYNSLGRETQCFQVTAYRRYKVAFHQPAYVVVYDYYKNAMNSAEAGMFSDRFGITSYIGKVMQLCDICEDEDCLTLSC